MRRNLSFQLQARAEKEKEKEKEVEKQMATERYGGKLGLAAIAERGAMAVRGVERVLVLVLG